MKKPSVSVIIPVFNRTELLLEAVSSVVAQSFRDFELVIVDDCSSEELRSAVLEIPGIGEITLKYIRLDKHSGMPGFVRNRGAEKAEGDYLAFLDSDDIWMPEKLEKQFEVIAGKAVTGRALQNISVKYEICHTREKWVRDGKPVSQAFRKHKREGDIFEDSLLKCIVGPSTVMMGKSLFEKYGGFREDLEVAEDYELWLKVTSENRILYIDEMLTVKRAGDWEQLSEKYGQIEIFRIKALKGLLENSFFTREREDAAAKVFRVKCLIYAAGCRKRGKDEEAEFYENLALGY
ncbi:MAG: glycosyltransferase family 2 protein [Spirochaetia bacterium]|jgi:glycosyltransferase involved in cell wall biosynthesis|nr:glycosyltransferase family 2 protein [Spirochaetia bacterium]